jgi:quinol monooxygenase YgiN
VAIAMIFDGQGMTQAQYDQARNEVAPDNQALPGMLFHVAGQIENVWRVIDVWESQEAADNFIKEKLGPALQRANVSAQPQVQVFQVHNIMRPR